MLCGDECMLNIEFAVKKAGGTRGVERGRMSGKA